MGLYSTTTGSLASQSSLLHNIITGDFTFTAWVYPFNVSSTRGVLGISLVDFMVWRTSSTWGVYIGGSHRGFGTPIANSWQHIAFSRINGILYGWQNGIKSGTTYDLSAYNLPNGVVRLCDCHAGVYPLDGIVSSLGFAACSASEGMVQRLKAGEAPHHVLPRCLLSVAGYGPIGEASLDHTGRNKFYLATAGSIKAHAGPEWCDMERPPTKKYYYHQPDASPPFTATAGLSLAGISCSLSGTFTKPSYTSTASLLLPAVTESSSGTFTNPTFTATVGVYLGPQTLESSGSFSIPDRTATSAMSVAPLTISSSGTFTLPVYTASATLSLPRLQTSVTGTFANPTYTASSSMSVGPLVIASSGTFSVHTYTATANLSLGSLTSSAIGTFITVSTGTASISMGAVTLNSSGTFTSPVYTASMSVSIGALTLSASATFQAMNNEATASLSMAPLTLAGVATYQPVYVATATLSLGALTLAGVAWLNPPVFYLEWSDSGESTVVDRLEGSSVLTEIVTGDCTVIDTITGSLRLRLTTTP